MIVRDLKIGESRQLFLIAGPCVIESETMLLKSAEQIKGITERLQIPWIFKSSYDKANRSSIHSFRGLGMDEGLQLLSKIRSQFDVPIITDIHTPKEAGPVGEVVDMIQIPAFLSRQTDLLVAAAKTGKPVNVKKGQFMAPEDMKNSIEKIKQSGNENVLLTERGTSFGYHNLVVDMRGLGIMKKLECPVIFDATHSVQRPVGLGNESGGDREYIPLLARSAVAAGVDGLFMEIHPDPPRAKCDTACQWPLNDLEVLLTKLIDIHTVINSEK